MEEKRSSAAEARFADIVWSNRLLSSGKLVKFCKEQLNWKNREKEYTMKKIISLALSLILCMGLIPFTAGAALETSGTVGSFTWSFDGVSRLTINGEGAMPDFDEYSEEAWRFSVIRKYTTELVITGNVTYIGDNAFRNFVALTNVNMPSSVVTISDYAFCNCDALENIDLPKSLTNIGEHAFSGAGLKRLVCPANLESIAFKAFSCCEQLEEIVFNDKLKSIGGYAFEEANSVEEIRLGKSVETIGDFAFCYSDAKVVSIPGSLKNIGLSIFAECIYIKTLILDKDFTDLDGLNVLLTARDLEEIIVDPDSPAYCAVGKTLYSKDMKTIVFYPRVSEEKEAIIADGTERVGRGAFAECDTLESVVIPDSVKILDEYAFCDGGAIESLEIPESVTEIGNCAFSGCKSLKNVNIPIGVTEISEMMFSGCSSLTDIFIHGGITSIGDYAFFHCSSLKSVTIPKSVTSIGERAFRECISLTNIKFNNSMEVIPYGMFVDCKGLETITLPKGITTISENAFSDCEALTSVYIPSTLSTVENWAFGYCDNLKNVYFEGTKAQWSNVSIGSGNDSFKAATVSYDYVLNFEVVLEEGDVNGDGAINSLDAAQVLKFDAYMIELDTDELVAADVNGDGAVNSLDAAMILKYDVGIITNFN